MVLSAVEGTLPKHQPHATRMFFTCDMEQPNTLELLDGRIVLRNGRSNFALWHTIKSAFATISFKAVIFKRCEFYEPGKNCEYVLNRKFTNALLFFCRAPSP
jgi:hypothetical protein